MQALRYPHSRFPLFLGGFPCRLNLRSVLRSNRFDSRDDFLERRHLTSGYQSFRFRIQIRRLHCRTASMFAGRFSRSVSSLFPIKTQPRSPYIRISSGDNTRPLAGWTNCLLPSCLIRIAISIHPLFRVDHGGLCVGLVPHHCPSNNFQGRSERDTEVSG